MEQRSPTDREAKGRPKKKKNEGIAQRQYDAEKLSNRKKRAKKKREKAN